MLVHLFSCKEATTTTTKPMRRVQEDAIGLPEGCFVKAARASEGARKREKVLFI